MNHSFKESVIIPYTLFKQCQFDKSTLSSESQNILRDSKLPSDLKMKLYSQSKALVPTNDPEMETSARGVDKETIDDIDYIAQLMPLKDQPYVSSILSKIKSRPDEISWNDRLEAKINGRLLIGSNIIDLLRFVMKNTIVTRATDIPTGARDFINKLYDIGVPKPWIKVTFPTKHQRRGATKRIRVDHSSDSETPTQEGFGVSWVTY